jgi:lysophospholipase L1-like esterase
MTLLVGACSDDRPKITAPASVLVVGDSILAQSADLIETRLADAGWIPVVDARSGSSISGEVVIDEGWAARIADLVEVADPDVVVVELGTNGCGKCPSLAEGIDSVMAELSDVDFVYWLNVREDAPMPLRPRALNQALDDAQSRWRNLSVLDMHTRFDGRSEWIGEDEVHLSPEGIVEFADFVVDALPHLRK